MKTLAQAKPGGTFEIKDWRKLERGAEGAPLNRRQPRSPGDLSTEGRMAHTR
jgi:hypothetical protein